VLVSLSGNVQTAPNYWLNNRNGVNYRVIVQAPQYSMDSLEKVGATPIAPRLGRENLQLLGNLASVERRNGVAVANHYNVQPVYDIYASIEGRDLAGVADEVDRVLDDVRAKLPTGLSITVRGQVESMRSSFKGLAAGLGIAILLIYFLMVVNFQSWLDPFIIAMALPAALAGILWMLCATHTTLNVPSLMGAIMAMGRSDREQHPAGDLRERPPRGRRRRENRGAGCRLHAAPSRADDGLRDDHRHAPDVAGPGRRR